MNYTIDEDVCEKNGIDIPTVLALLLVKTGVDINVLFKELVEKKLLMGTTFKDYYLTQKCDDLICNILLDSDKSKQPLDRIENLALKLMEVFPKEKKAGTCHYFRGNKKDISLRLKKFFKLYGNRYTDEEIINAAKEYVKSFNGNYSYMRILKYFIWKDERKMDSDGNIYIEEISDLATCIENKGQDYSNDNWTSTLK